jgi:hypothetical protein
MKRAMSFLTTSRAPAFADQKEGSRSLYLALPQQSLYSFPDPQGHLSLGFGMEHLQLFAYTEHYTFRVSERRKFHGSVKKGPDLWTGAADALVDMRVKLAPKSETSPAWRMHNTTIRTEPAAR